MTLTIETELPAVKVKELEWKGMVPHAETIVGLYSTNHIGGEWNVRFSMAGHGCGDKIASGKEPDFESALIAAKAAAQADYERRILSVIVATPKPRKSVAEKLIDEAQFLLDRLDEINLDDDTDDLIRDWNGHVEPSIARLRSAISAALNGRPE